MLPKLLPGADNSYPQSAAAPVILARASVDLSRVGGPSYETYGLFFDGDGDGVAGGRTAKSTVFDTDRVGTYKTVGGLGFTKINGYTVGWHTATTSLR
jgi:hypothetical protein